MKKNNITIRSENKAKTIRMLHRNQMFQKNRQTQTGLSYMSYYEPQAWSNIKKSLELQIPDQLPSLCRETISLYRRDKKPVYKTRVDPNCELDPHMTFESLWSLAGTQDIEEYLDFQYVIKEFQDELKHYLCMPFPEIKQMAIIAAGNKILGKQDDIMTIIQQDENYLWVLINHIYERKINFEVLYKYLQQDFIIVYRTIYEMTNNPKDQIIDSITKNQNILSWFLKSCQNTNQQIQSYAMRIIGNILAQREDYASLLANYKILETVYPALRSKNSQIRRQTCWLISNYAFERTSARQIICNSKLMERLFTMLKDEQKVEIKNQLYYIFVHIIGSGQSKMAFKMVLQQKIIDQCAEDIQIDNMDLVIGILSLIDKIIDLGDQFVSYEDESGNYFINYINYSHLRKGIYTKTFCNNSDISQLSFEIMDKLNVGGTMDSDMM